MGRRSRGDIRVFLLFALSERPMSGYEVIRFFTELTHGLWKPSQGSVYPTLQLLQETGLATAEKQGGKTVYTITEAGRREAERLPKGSFDQDPEQLGAITSLREANLTIRHLIQYLLREGSVPQLQQAGEIMHQARQQLTELLGKPVGRYDEDNGPV